MSLTRHEIREKAFQALFALNANPDADEDQLFQQLLNPDDNAEIEIPSYLSTLVTGVLEHQAELDAQIQPYLSQAWSLDRLAKTDLIILRLAFFELTYVDDVPDKVAINEAIELTKAFSDERSRKFVSGVLGKTVGRESI
ncbi:transcription antitermination factor NusB [Lactiplantibacillus mudanjiangensis]|uniref:Transcription antitermination protein NusB n=1 Tax=Lactiplantibacillus mudanjiangensis TaxID=1296538 RepID=A0A660E9R1_9LACO|nr:transcription antitermination factor NusB [Lactiplantibacillus mudanjiangensis]VDG19820.1 transcription antitermination protein NusB [Lactobacillus plantarum JDM1] [Lactiplantibacillus mudanjiangensis]VDG24499.1 transcription antitermination protein NusB [Lactobacillus plantarum JDM1] [Lactiplantibacillus mudanjiangensis]VDG29790.1 transcription antitermination protein NusB [Lactobacillus plantarum JDM1] [Lactiplantibacillus mudanjiangensis]VDG31246.1 transcription antitermination protein Nu